MKRQNDSSITYMSENASASTCQDKFIFIIEDSEQKSND
jgi:hypothetical protein